MNTLGIILLSIAALAGIVVIWLSLEISKGRNCSVCGKAFKPSKQETVAELIDGRWRVKCDKCAMAAPFRGMRN